MFSSEVIATEFDRVETSGTGRISVFVDGCNSDVIAGISDCDPFSFDATPLENWFNDRMKCAEEDWSLDREWTRIHANSRSGKVWVHFEWLLNRRGL
jgi:hypothetical protein